jgi:hypothetical protein
MFYVIYQVCKSPLKATSVTLFHGLVTISEKCYCSLALCTERAKITCEAEQGG